LISATEADAMMKLPCRHGQSCYLAAMFAQSPICDGQPQRLLDDAWPYLDDTDRRRSGLFLLSFLIAQSFEDYAEYALTYPMYFIVRHGRWIDMTGIRSAAILPRTPGERATMEDWTQHLRPSFLSPPQE